MKWNKVEAKKGSHYRSRKLDNGMMYSAIVVVLVLVLGGVGSWISGTLFTINDAFHQSEEAPPPAPPTGVRDPYKR